MDALRQSILRAQLAKPLSGGAPAGGAQMSSVARGQDFAAIDARFSALDRKLDTLIHMLEGPGRNRVVSHQLFPADVRRVVARFFDVTDEDLDRRARRGSSARIRQIAYYLCRTYTTRSFAEIGQVFHRDHATILHGVQRIGALRKTDAALDDDLPKLEARLADMLARRNAT